MLNTSFLIGIGIWVIAGIAIGIFLSVKINKIRSNFQDEMKKIRNYMLLFFLLIAIFFVIAWTQGWL
jgi:hypothetical protein